MQVVGGQDEVGRPDPGHRPAQLPVPGRRRPGQLRVHHRAEQPVQPAQPRPVPQPEQPGGLEAGLVEQPEQLVRIELAVVERVQRPVRRRERQPVRRGDQQRARRPEHPRALGQETGLVPEVLEHLQRRDHVHAARAYRQAGQVAPHRGQPRVRRGQRARPRPRRSRSATTARAVLAIRSRAVPLAAAGLQHDRAGAERHAPRRTRPRAGGTSSFPSGSRAACAPRSVQAWDAPQKGRMQRNQGGRVLRTPVIRVGRPA